MDSILIETTITLRKLTVTEGYVLTDGENYVRDFVFLGKNDSSDNWYEITDAEYAEILAKQEAELEEHL